MEIQTMDNITQARHNFVLAFQYCWNGEEFPVFREISVCEDERIHTGYCAIDLLDEALELNPDFQEARNLRGDIWHAILTENGNDNYQIYLKSKAWAETRAKFFEQVGRLCICSDPATEVHHKTYENLGKEDILKDLVGLCKECHGKVHQSKKSNRSSDNTGRAYWDKFKSYVKENGNRLQLFPEPDLPSIYGIQIDGKTRKSTDIRKEDAFWLVAYRDANKLQANLYMQSSAHYSVLKEQKEEINGKFDDNLGVLRWEDNGKHIGFLNDTVEHVSIANTNQEFSWLHDRLVRLYEVFQPIVLEL